MKKLLLLLLPLLLFVSCKDNSKKSDSSKPFRVAMITDSADITDQSFNQNTYMAVKSFCDEKNIDYNYFKPLSDITAARVVAFDAAIQEGYNILVFAGYVFADTVVETVELYPDVYFVALDVGEGDIKSAATRLGKGENWQLPGNVFCATYEEEISGFMAGYAAVKEGFRHLGFLGGIAVPGVIRFGYGFVQGADIAATELNVEEEVSVEYIYAGQFYGDQQIKAAMDGWYKKRGVEVVFACGGGIWQSAADAAKDCDGKMIGVDTDQSELMNAYKEGMCVTSAMKGLSTTVHATLTAILEGRWEEYSGNFQCVGLVSGTNPEENFVQLPVDTWSMKNFTIDDYKKLVADIYNEKIVVNDNYEQEPSVSITVNKYPNIK